MTKMYFKPKNRFSCYNITNSVVAFSMLVFSFNSNAQCPASGVTLSTQAQVNAFPGTYPGCTQLSGDLFIGTPNGTTDITNLTPLANITAVGGNLAIYNNADLTSLAGLSKLISINGYLRFTGNPSITHINELSGVTSIGKDVKIEDNSALTNLDGLSSVKSIGGYLVIKNNDALLNLNGLNNLTSTAKDIEINGNAILSDISGLKNTTFNPNGSYGLTIQNNPALAVCNLPNFCAFLANPSGTHPRTISGNLTNCLNVAAVTTACNSAVVNIPDANFKSYLLGVSAINTNADNEIQVSEAWAFTGEIDCSFKNITDLTGIEAFKALTKLDCGGNKIANIDLSQNIALMRLACASNLFTNLDLTTNKSLTAFFCEANPNLTRLNIKNGTNASLDTMWANNNQKLTCIEVDNATNANSYSKWQKDATASYNTNCTISSVSDLGKMQMVLYPNPANDKLYIELNEPITVQIIDLVGKPVQTAYLTNGKNMLDISKLSAGMYFIQSATGKSVRFLKH